MPVFGLWDWIICVGYLLVVLALGFWFARQQHTNEDYFVGGRRMHWLPIGLSIFAGTFSSLSFVGLPREGAYDDWHLLTGILFIPLVVMPIVGWLFIPLYFRLRVTSAYEYLERRFHPAVRRLASGLFVFYTVGWMGALLKAVGEILQPVLQLSHTQLVVAVIVVGIFATFYTALGGVKAVVWTDALQALALGGGMLAVLLLAVARIDGGWQTVWQVGNEHHKFDMAHLQLSFRESNLFGACAFGFFVYLAGHAVHFTAVQRYVSMPTIGAARRSLAVNGIMVAVVCVIFFLAGTTVFVFYHPGTTTSTIDMPMTDSIAMDAGSTTNWYDALEYTASKQQSDEKNREDQLLPRFIMSEIPAPGLMGLLLAGLFAAAMSSMDSGINSLTATVVCDWGSRAESSLAGSRLLTVVFGTLAVGTAVLLQQFDTPVFHTIMTIAGTFLGLMLGVFLLGMLSPRSNTPGALIGVAAGLVIFLTAKFSGMTAWWDGACTTTATLFVGLLASLMFRPPSQEQLQGLQVGAGSDSQPPTPDKGTSKSKR